VKTTETAIPVSLREVWEWKSAIHEEIRGLTPPEQRAYYRKRASAAAKLIRARIVVLPDGTRRLA
jgi:hypothetical protein